MTTIPLYSLRTDGDQYRITKFVDGDVESTYLCTESECECPAGHRHTCRHRQMLPTMLAHKLANTHWFFAFDAGGAIVDFNGTPKRLFDALAAMDGLQIMGLDDIGAVHNAIADAVGEPEAKLAVPEGQHVEGHTQPITTEQLDQLQFGRVLHNRPWRRL